MIYFGLRHYIYSNKGKIYDNNHGAKSYTKKY